MSQEKKNRFKDVLLEVNGPPCIHPNIKMTTVPDDLLTSVFLQVYCEDCEMNEIFAVDHKKLAAKVHEVMRPKLFDPFKDQFHK